MASSTSLPSAFVVPVLIAAGLVATVGVSQAQTSCFGRSATIIAQAGEVTIGTSGPDVIIGTAGPDVIDGRGGNDRICSLGGADTVSGGPGRDRLDLGSGDDVATGGRGNDIIRGRRGRDTLRGSRGADELRGGPGRDVLRGGRGMDDCHGNAGRDRGRSCASVRSLTEDVSDTFAGNGPLVGYTTNNAQAVPGVARVAGRYSAPVTTNADNITLHFNGDQGRLDAKLVEFPFDIIVRNIGVGTLANSQAAASPAGNPYVFAGVQVHVPDLDDRTSSHVVVGHRGATHFTIEGKNTNNGSSSVNDAGANIASSGRADIRIVGNADRTLTVYWQPPSAGSPAADNWIAYNGDGRLPGAPPNYPGSVYVGLITYAFGSHGLPFQGTADAIEVG